MAHFFLRSFSPLGVERRDRALQAPLRAEKPLYDIASKGGLPLGARSGAERGHRSGVIGAGSSLRRLARRVTRSLEPG